MRQFNAANDSVRVPVHATPLTLVVAGTLYLAIVPALSRAMPAFELAAAVDAPGDRP